VEEEEDKEDAVELACGPLERLGDDGGVISCKRGGLELLVGVTWEDGRGAWLGWAFGMIESMPGRQPDS